MKRLLCLGTLICLGWLPFGCSPAHTYESVPVFEISGILTYQGKPMSGAVITFHPSDSKLTAQGTANIVGEYYLTTYLTDDGAPPGKYAVTIYWPDSSSKPPTNDPDPPLPPDRLKFVYANAKTTKLRATVLEEPEIIDFHLP